MRIRLPQTQPPLWVLVAEAYDATDQATRTLVWLTNVAVEAESDAQAPVVVDRLRSRIEHGYRFAQEQGLDVENMRGQTLARMRRLHPKGTRLVLVAAQFGLHLMQTWSPTAVRWRRRRGGKRGEPMDRDGPYLLLRGLQVVWQTVATLTLLAVEPFPHDAFT